MKIAINTRLLIPGKLEGIGSFTCEIFRLLALQHPEHEFHLISDRKPQNDWQWSSNVVQHCILPPARRPFLFDWWFDYSIPRKLKRIKADVFISPDGHASRRCPIPQLTVIHDLNFVHYPSFMPPAYANYWNTRTAQFVKCTTRLATVSEFSKRDIIQTYALPASQIDVIGNGVAPHFAPLPSAEKERIRLKWNKGRKYVLFVGSLHPRKNVHRMVEAFASIASEFPEVDLLIAGRMFWTYSDLDLAIAKVPATRIQMLGHVSRTDLPLLVGASESLLFASIYEGFGIPLLEAEACKVPVIASQSSVSEEITDGSCFLVNPLSTEDVAKAMTRILQGERKEATRDTISLYSWQNAATRMWESIQKTLQA